MENVKAISTPFANYFKLSAKQSPSNEDEKLDMKQIPHASATMSSLIYAPVCTRSDISHDVSIISRFLSNLGRER